MKLKPLDIFFKIMVKLPRLKHSESQHEVSSRNNKIIIIYPAQKMEFIVDSVILSLMFETRIMVTVRK